MNFIGWSDGSFYQNNTGYVAYVIKDETNKEERFCAYIDNLQTSQEAETYALYFLFKRVLEMGIQQFSLFTDCKGLCENIDGKPFVSHFENSFGKENTHKLLSKLTWKTRKENLAHLLFENKESMFIKKLSKFPLGIKTSVTPSPFNGTEYFDAPVLKVTNSLKKLRTKNKKENNSTTKLQPIANEEHFVISFKDQDVKVPARIVDSFKKSLHFNDDQQVLSELREKMLSSTIIEEDDTIVFKKGRLVISLRNYVIQNLSIQANQPKESSLEKQLILLNIPNSYHILNKPITTIPDFPFSFVSKVYNKFTKNKDVQTSITSLQKAISNGPFLQIGNVQLFMKGKLHVMVENGIIVDIKTQTSQYTLQKLKESVS